MRCSKCGQSFLFNTKYCPKCGQSLVSTKKKLPRSRSWGRYLLILFLILSGLSVIAGFLISNSAWSEKREEMIYGIIGLAFIVFIIAVIVILFIKFIKVIVKFFFWLKTRPVFLIIALVLVVGGIFGIYYAYQNLAFKSWTKKIVVFQDALSEMVLIRNQGDLLLASSSQPVIYSWSLIQKDSASMADLLANLSLPRALQAYKKNVVVWAAKVREAAKNTNSWKNLEALPAEFEISLTSKQTSALIRLAVIRVGGLKSFGDQAIKNKDLETLRRIAAKLKVQTHWLTGLGNMKKSWAGLIISPAQAYTTTAQKICFTTYNGKPLCVPEVIELTTEAYQVTTQLESEAQAQAWDKAWAGETATAVVAEAETGYYLEDLAQVTMGDQELTAADGRFLETQAGLVSGTEKKPVEPLRVTRFIDGCYGAGGILGGANQIVDRIPTTEAGRYCGFKDKQHNNCWRYLTNSGAYYSGGDSGCLEINLIPRGLANIAQALKEIRQILAEPTPAAVIVATTTPPVVPKTTPKTTRPTPKTSTPVTPKTNVEPSASPITPPPTLPPVNPPVVEPEKPKVLTWDGEYSFQESGSCSVTDDGVFDRTYSSGTSGRWSVANNQFTYTQITTFPTVTISAGGQANVSGPGATQDNMNIHLNFSRSGERVLISGTKDSIYTETSYAWGTIIHTCNYTISGFKID